VKEREQIVRGTVQQVMALSGKYLNTDRMIWLVVGDAKTQLPRLKGLGFGEPILIRN
jgi:zinc protease